MRVYIPSFWGDVEILGKGSKESILKTSNLSMDEIALVKGLLKKYKVPEPSVMAPATFTLPASLEKVHAQVAKLLKKGRPTITAIKLSNGRLEEVQTLAEGEKKLAADGVKEEDRKAVTTPVPTRGCPMPVYDALKARAIRATRVLLEFLNPTQAKDYANERAVIVVGGRSGKKYRVAHRESEIASNFGMVSEIGGISVCCHHTDMPAAEEVLALLVALSCPTTEMAWINSHG
jgi:hypothetical protein